MIYLDTNVIIWLYLKADSLISKKTKDLINNSEYILISPMVLLELDFLFEIGKTRKPSKYVNDYLKQKIGLRICKKPFEEIVRFASDQNWTRDPFDRIITAQAGVGSNTLITKDREILKNYKHAIW